MTKEPHSRIFKAGGDVSSGMSVLNPISEGPMFRTYKAKTGTKFVVLKSTMTQGAMQTELLRREYEIGRSLSHPCIVSTIDFLEKSPVGTAIVMEYIEGVPLGRFLKSNPSSAQRKVVLSDILSGVDYLHHRGVIHNDLKPSNIIVTANGAARIIDFGLSLSDDSAYRGAVGGSEGYSAPELNESISTPASDIFSLGKLTADIYGGRQYRDVVVRATAADPSKRYQSISQLQAAFGRSRVKSIIKPAAIALFSAAVLASGVFFGRAVLSKPAPPLTVEQYMDSLYRSAFDKASSQPYSEFAYNAVAEYLHHCCTYGDSLPEQEREKVISIYNSQIPTLNEIVESKPSINTLSPEEQAALLNKLMNGEML